jgi:hypothetical protein
MGARQRQSNTIECCPLCARPIKTRFAATSHYEAHVRRGELEAEGERIEKGSRRYRIPEAGRKTIFEDEWWQRGFKFDKYRMMHAEDEDQRLRWIENDRIQFFVALDRRRY